MPDPTVEGLIRTLGTGYTFVRELGGGGMSRVFVVHDERLSRDIVVKQLPPDAGAALSSERFDREIALAARLQHPHIVPVLGAGRTAESLPYYTMPYVQGESLRARLSRAGELPVAQAVTILREVGRALQYAHERGIVHRDIKPDNILLSGGAALVTDFGVAKAITASATGESEAAMTQLGVALGTPAYMAPEQAAAEQSVDQRADLYAFGCVAYEMLAGAPPFSGRNAAALLAAQVSEMPEPLEKRRPATPPDLAALVMSCLEKRPADRPQSAADVLAQLDRISLTPPGTSARAAVPARHTGRWRAAAPWLIAVAASAVAISLAVVRPESRASNARVIRFELDQSQVPLVGTGITIAPSPLGDGLVYRGGVDRSNSALYWRGYEDAAPRMIPGTEQGEWPQFSPDGSSLYFYAHRRFKRMPAKGGAVVDLGEAHVVGVSAFLPDGRIVQGGRPNTGLFVLDSKGGRTPLTRPDSARDERDHTGPLAFDGGKRVAYLANRRSSLFGQGADVAILTVASGETRILELQAIRVVAVREGFLVTVSPDRSIIATPFDENTATITGASVPIVEGLLGNSAMLGADGTLAYMTEVADRIVRRDMKGQIVQTLYTGPPSMSIADLRLSPDGRKAVVAPMQRGRPRNVYALDLATGAFARATDGVDEWTAAVTPNGRDIVYTSKRDGPRGIYRQPLDGSAPPVLVARMNGSFWGVTADGLHALYGEGGEILMVPLSGGAPKTLLRGVQPMMSRDGKLLAYVTSETGRQEVYVRRYPSLTERVLVSTTGGVLPRWGPDSRTLFFRGAGAQRVARLETLGELRVSRVDSLFASEATNASFGNYDVAPDGRSFVEIMPVEATQRAVITLNWTRQLEQLKRR